MIADSEAAPSRAVDALKPRLGAHAALAGITVAAAFLRIVGAAPRTTPSYFPDEYIYAALSRSLGTQGRPLIRGASAHFPALLEPLLVAPLWALASSQEAYRLVQVENAVFMSLAAVPVYLLARRLDLGTSYSLFCAAFAIAIPDLSFSGSILADPVAYPFVLAALYAGVAALQAPGRRYQLGFVAFAILSTLARVQYAALVPAFVVGALLLDGRAAHRTQRLPLGIFAAGIALLAALGPGRLLGYYATIESLHFNWGLLRWSGLDLFLLSLAGGVVLVPGAVAGVACARDRRDRAFAVLVTPYAAALLLESALYTSNGFGQFKERYLFTLLPLVPIGFGLYLKNGRPMRMLATGLALLLAVLALLLPVGDYVGGQGFGDSPLLWCVSELQRLLGYGDASLFMAACAVAAAGLAATVAWTRIRWIALVTALVFVGGLSLGATVFAADYASVVASQAVAADPSWVDDSHVGPVTAIETGVAPPAALITQLFWNRSIDRELVVGGAQPTDAFATGVLGVTPDGVLSSSGRPLGSAFLFQGFEVTARFRDAVPVARYSSFTLYRPTGTPRLAAYELGRYWDGWLAPQGGLEIWPTGTRGGTVSFTLSLPTGSPDPATVRIGARSYRLMPGEHVLVSFRIPGGRPWSARFSATAGTSRLPDHRVVSVRSTTPNFTPA